MSKITNSLFSTTNSKIKLFCKLLNDKKYREKEQKFVVESEKCIYEAVKAGYEPEAFFITKPLASDSIINNYPKRTFLITSDIAKKLSFFPTNQGVFAIFNFKKERSQNLYNEPFLILSGIQDPVNLGNILRLARCFKIKNVVIDNKTVDFYHPKVIRGAMGGNFHLNIYYSNIITIIKLLKSKQYQVFATCLNKTSKKINEIEWSKKIALVFGNEGSGLSEEIIKVCNSSLYIPIESSFDSLNVNNAVAICLWEYYKKCKK